VGHSWIIAVYDEGCDATTNAFFRISDSKNYEKIRYRCVGNEVFFTVDEPFSPAFLSRKNFNLEQKTYIFLHCEK